MFSPRVDLIDLANLKIFNKPLKIQTTKYQKTTTPRTE